MTKSAKLFGLGLALTGLVGGSNSGWCDTVVVSSESRKYAVGDQLKDDASVELKAQETLRLMDSNSGETRVLNGPYVGRISAYAPPCAGVVACDAGKKQLSIGATRALTGAAPK